MVLHRGNRVEGADYFDEYGTGHRDEGGVFKGLGHEDFEGVKEELVAADPAAGRPAGLLLRWPCHVCGQEIALVADFEELFVIGGEQIYRAALARADRIYLTEVESEYEGDTRFPELPPGEWREVSRERHPGGAGTPGCSFVVLERARAGARPRAANPGAAPRRPASNGTG